MGKAAAMPPTYITKKKDLYGMSSFFMPSKQQETRLYYEKENRNLW
jgi:hypothetical protein